MGSASHIWVSIVKALIKTIPIAGAGIEELVFGAKASIESEELKLLVEKIANAVENDNLTEQTFEKFVKSEPIQAILSSLASADDSVYRQADELVMNLRKQSGEIAQIQLDITQNHELIQSGIENLETLFRASQKELTKALTSLPSRIRERSEKDRTPLKTIQRWLHEIDTKDLSFVADAVSEAAQLDISNAIITIDFSELYSYAHAPFQYDRLSSFTVFVMTQRDLDFRILRPTVTELYAFYRNELQRFRDPNSIAEDIHEALKTLRIRGQSVDLISLANAAGYFQSPLKRMRRLMENIPTFDIELPHVAEKNELHELTFDISKQISLLHSGKRSRMNDVVDAKTLALGSFINEEADGKKRPLILVTRSKLIHELSRKMMERRTRYTLPKVVHPATLAYRSLCDEQDSSILTQLNRNTLELNRQIWLDLMDNFDSHSAVNVQQTLQSAADALDYILPTVTPLHEAIFETVLADLVEARDMRGKTVWQSDFESVYTQLSNVVDSYSSYVDDATRAVKPFYDLQPSRTEPPR